MGFLVGFMVGFSDRVGFMVGFSGPPVCAPAPAQARASCHAQHAPFTRPHAVAMLSTQLPCSARTLHPPSRSCPGAHKRADPCTCLTLCTSPCAPDPVPIFTMRASDPVPIFTMRACPVPTQRGSCPPWCRPRPHLILRLPPGPGWGGGLPGAARAQPQQQQHGRGCSHP